MYFLFICCAGWGVGAVFMSAGRGVFARSSQAVCGFCACLPEARCALHCALSRRCACVLRRCSQPAGLASFCFFANFCVHCLFARSACCLRGGLSCFFALSCLTSSSQNSFYLSLRPRRASTFFRKESRQRFARGRGSAPFEPHSCALRPIFSSSALLAGLTALWAANRRLTGKRLKSQGAKLSFSSVFCAKGDACALSPISPFLSLLAGLTALRAANRRLARETPEKPKEQSSAFRAFLCVGERVAPRYSFQIGNLARAFARLQGTETRLSPRLGKQKLSAGPHPEPAACVRGAGKEKTGCANCPAQPRRCFLQLIWATATGTGAPFT